MNEQNRILFFMRRKESRMHSSLRFPDPYRKGQRKESTSMEGEVTGLLSILFVCHGNICRSPMAEFMMKDLVRKEGIEEKFQIASAATTTDEIWGGRGNPVYPPAERELALHGIGTGDNELGVSKKRARLMTRADYQSFDLIIGMDAENLYDMKDIAGGDPEGKIHLLMDFTPHPGSVADPWYTRNFSKTWSDLAEGIPALLSYCRKKYHI